MPDQLPGGQTLPQVKVEGPQGTTRPYLVLVDIPGAEQRRLVCLIDLAAYEGEDTSEMEALGFPLALPFEWDGLLFRPLGTGADADRLLVALRQQLEVHLGAA